MEVFFSPIYRDHNNLKCYSNFCFIKLYDLNILCDCPLICKNDIDFNENEELFQDLDLEELDDDTLFPAVFLYKNINNNEKINIDLILISNPKGLIGIPFLLHYNKFERNYDKNNNELKHNKNNNESKINLYKWILKHPIAFDITNSTLLVTPPVYQSAIIGLQQMIEYYSHNLSNNIIDPFLSLKTSDLFGIISSNMTINDKNNFSNDNHFNNEDHINNEDDSKNDINSLNNNYDLYNNKESLRIRHNILSNLPENGPEYYYNKFNINDDHFKKSDKFEDQLNNENISRGSTTGLGAAVNAASHIFDGNVGQNIPATIGFNTSNSNTSHAPLFGQITGEELSYYPRLMIESHFLSKSIESNHNKNSYVDHLQIKIIHIGEIIKYNKDIFTFNVHSFNSGFCLGGVGYHISTRNIDFNIEKLNENLTIIGPSSTELERYPAPLYLNDLLDTNNIIYYGNYLNKVQESNKEHLINIKKISTKEEINENILIKDIDINNEKKDDFVKNISINKDVDSNINNDNNILLNKYSDFYQLQIDNIIKNIINTLEKYGSILIPVDCFGQYCLELVEYIGYKISELSVSIQAPIYVVGGGLSTLILNADISSEWTTPSRTRKVMLPNPNPPFLFSFLKKSNRLYVFHTIEELSAVYREPAIFIASNSNLKFGPCIDLFNILCNKIENTLLIIDGSVNIDNLINKLEKKPQMKIIHIPIYIEPHISDLIDNMIPYYEQNKNSFNIIIPECDKFSLFNNPIPDLIKNNIKLIPNKNIIEFNKNNRIFTCSNDWIPVKLSTDITENTIMKEIDSSVFIGKNNCKINFNQGELLLEHYEDSDNEDNKDDEIILFGKITMKSFLKGLKDNNINDFTINNNEKFGEEEVTCLQIPSLSCKIIICSSNNFIINTNIQKSRDLIYNIISSLITCI